MNNQHFYKKKMPGLMLILLLLLGSCNEKSNVKKELAGPGKREV